MKVLIIEDKADDVRGILDHAVGKGWEAKQLGFEDGLHEMDSFNPDVVVLDMKDDVTQNDQYGVSIFSIIWKIKFRPTIVFSGLSESFAIEDEATRDLAREPLFVRIPKGDEDPVIRHLDYLADIVPSITHMRERLNTALIMSAGAITTIKSASSRTSEKVLDYLFSSRITQFFEAEVPGEKLPAWTQFVSPPISEQLLTGDILRSCKDGASADDSVYYAIVLTPSCDLARAEKKACVLIAQSCEFSSIDGSFGNTFRMGTDKYNKRRDRMGKIMNRGYDNSKLYLPALKGVFPHLCFDMKKVKLTTVGDIQCASTLDIRENSPKWIRLASLASPYRERASWAYMHTACRPGVPTIDTDSWVDEIFQ